MAPNWNELDTQKIKTTQDKDPMLFTSKSKK